MMAHNLKEETSEAISLLGKYPSDESLIQVKQVNGAYKGTNILFARNWTVKKFLAHEDKFPVAGRLFPKSTHFEKIDYVHKDVRRTGIDRTSYDQFPDVGVGENIIVQKTFAFEDGQGTKIGREHVIKVAQGANEKVHYIANRGGLAQITLGHTHPYQATDQKEVFDNEQLKRLRVQSVLITPPRSGNQGNFLITIWVYLPNEGSLGEEPHTVRSRWDDVNPGQGGVSNAPIPAIAPLHQLLTYGKGENPDERSGSAVTRTVKGLIDAKRRMLRRDSEKCERGQLGVTEARSRGITWDVIAESESIKILMAGDSFAVATDVLTFDRAGVHISRGNIHKVWTYHTGDGKCIGMDTIYMFNFNEADVPKKDIVNCCDQVMAFQDEEVKEWELRKDPDNHTMELNGWAPKRIGEKRRSKPLVDY